MGSGTDYSGQINNSLAQSNTPKSSLAQEYSGLLGGIAPGILSSLLNTQNLGNSFLNVNGASSIPGGTQNQQQQQFNPFNSRPRTDSIQGSDVPPADMGMGGIDPNGLEALFNRNAGRMTQNGYEPSDGATPTGTATPTVSNPAYTSQKEQQYFQQGQGLGNPGQGQQGGINLQGFQGANPNFGAMNNGFSNLNPSIANLLSQIGGNPQQASFSNVGQSGFQQQQANPGMIQNPGFQAQGANLGNINTGLGLSGDSLDSFNAIANILKQQSDAGIADTRERFTGLGGSRGTGASYAEGQQRAALIPQLQSALSNARNQEVSNQLQSAGLQSNNALQNAGMLNQYGLGGAQLDVQRQGQNVSNMLNALGINNQYGLGNAQLNAQIGQGNQQAGMQTSIANQNAQLQNNQNQNNLLAQLLGQQGQNINSQNQNQLGMNGILAQLAQANSSGANQFNLGVAGLNQQAAQQQIQNQLQTLMSLFGTGAGMAGAGIPGGSTNVNIGNNQQSGGFGQGLAGLASILSAFG